MQSATIGEGGDVTEADLEAALVRAVLSGRDALAETLRVALARRQRERAGNVVELPTPRRRGR